MKLSVIALILVGATTLGCAPSLKPDGTGGSGAAPPGGDKVVTTDHGDGSFTTTVDATSTSEFVYFDFESQSEKIVDKPLNSVDWDLGFQRHLIPSNGGISGPGGVMVAALEGDQSDMEDAPATGYLTDVEDPAEDGDEDPDFVFNAIPTSWFDYNDRDHTLSPANRTYVVRTVEGRHYTVRINDYYDAVGTAGFLSFTWREVGPPSTPDSITVDASSGPVYLSVAAGGPVSVGDPATSTEWDLMIDENTLIRTNGGTSGMGLGAAALGASEVAYEDVSSANTVGFTVDEMIVPPGPPGQPDTSGHALLNLWYLYDSMSHKVTTKGDVFLIRTADGSYGKFQIIYFADGVYELRLAPVTREVTTHSADVDASAGWTYFSLTEGVLKTPDEPAMSIAWDLAFNGIEVQTNSGTSGMAEGGALDPSVVTLAEITTAPAAGYAVDEMITHRWARLLGQPGAQPLV